MVEPYLAQFVGSDTEEVGAKLVRPVARTMVRYVLNQPTSEEDYRPTAASRWRDFRWSGSIRSEAEVTIDTVQLQQHRFNTTYEQMIRDKLAEQEAERISSEIQAVRAEMEREYETVTRTEGHGHRAGGWGDAAPEARGRCPGLREAPGGRGDPRGDAGQGRCADRAGQGACGSGGRNTVKLKVGEQLRGKKILFLPAGDGMDSHDRPECLVGDGRRQGHQAGGRWAHWWLGRAGRGRRAVDIRGQHKRAAALIRTTPWTPGGGHRARVASGDRGEPADSYSVSKGFVPFAVERCLRSHGGGHGLPRGTLGCGSTYLRGGCEKIIRGVGPSSLSVLSDSGDQAGPALLADVAGASSLMLDLVTHAARRSFRGPSSEGPAPAFLGVVRRT